MNKHDPHDEMHESMIMMQDGRVMIVKKGELTLLEEELTLPDGTWVRPDGMIRTPDGKTRMLVQGETLRKFGQTPEQTNMPETGSTEEMTRADTHDPS